MTTKHPPLTLSKFRQWLESQPSSARFHSNTSCCPVAKYLGGKPRSGRVAVGRRNFRVGGRPSDGWSGKLPEWATAFIYAFDRREKRGLTGPKRALEILIKTNYRMAS